MLIKTSSRLFIFLFFAIVANVSIAQERENYKLLWEIEHKDSDKKSYLFGTIHLKDKRVFNFSDAVLPAIRSTESFALEVHPDSISDGFGNSIFKMETENIYRKVLTEEEYERLDKRYRELQGEPLDSAMFKNPIMVESQLTEDLSKADDKRTFLDGYLYGIAYSLDKKIYGLEKLEDQLPAVEDLSEEEIRTNILSILDSEEGSYDEYVEDLVAVYHRGNIEEIYLRSMGLFTVDLVLNARNHVMANSIEKVMKSHSLFAAVGTAHLPGKEGIIEILRRKGFTVNPVEATFDKEHEDFDIQPNLKKWHTDNRPDLGYTVMTPTEAAPLEYNENLEIMMATDVIFGGVFGYMAIDLRGQVMQKDFDYVGNVIKQQTNGVSENLISRKSFEKDGVTYTDLTMLTNEGYARMMLTVANRFAYSFFTQNSLDELHTPYVDAFFDSIKIRPPYVAAAIWTPKSDVAGAYTVRFPDEVKDMSQEVENPNGAELLPYFLNIYGAQDKADDMIYILRYNDQPLGYYLSQQDEHEAYFTEYFGEKGTIIGEPRPFKIDNYHGLEYELLLSDQFHAFARVFVRGNRTYVMLAQKSVTDEKVNIKNEFFNSFELSKYQPASFDSIIKIDDRYSFKLPKRITKEIDSSSYYISEYSSTTTYMGLQEATGGVYGMVHATLKPYFATENITKFYDEYTQSLVEEGDSLVMSRSITISGKPARELLIINKNSDVKEQMKMLLDNENVLLLQAYIGEEEIQTSFVDDFLKSLKVEKSKKTFDPFSSKTRMIVKDLNSRDSISFTQAKDALRYYNFTARDVGLLFDALNGTYPYDTKYSNTKKAILDALLYIGGADVLKELEKFYKKPDTDDALRVYLLSEFFLLKEGRTEATYFDLVENHKPKRDPDGYYNIFGNMRDSLQLLIKNKDRLSPLLEVDDYRDRLVSLYEFSIRTDSTSMAPLSSLGIEIKKYMRADVLNYTDSLQRKTKPHLNYSLIDNYLSIIDITKDQSEDAEDVLRNLYQEKDSNSWLPNRALILAIKSGHVIDNAILSQKLEDMYSRFEVMDALSRYGDKTQIPGKFLEADAFSKLSLYNAIGADDDYPDILNKLGTFKYNNTSYVSFAYGFSGDENDRRFLGATIYKAGNPDELKANEAYWIWREIETDWQSQAIQMLKEQLTDLGN